MCNSEDTSRGYPPLDGEGNVTDGSVDNYDFDWGTRSEDRAACSCQPESDGMNSPADSASTKIQEYEIRDI